MPFADFRLHAFLLCECDRQPGPLCADDLECVEVVASGRFRQRKKIRVAGVFRAGEVVYQPFKGICVLRGHRSFQARVFFAKAIFPRLFRHCGATAPRIVVDALRSIREDALDLMNALDLHQHGSGPSTRGIRPAWYRLRGFRECQIARLPVRDLRG